MPTSPAKRCRSAYKQQEKNMNDPRNEREAADMIRFHPTEYPEPPEPPARLGLLFLIAPVIAIAIAAYLAFGG